jgi:CRP-like cAMP-binding protein
MTAKEQFIAFISKMHPPSAGKSAEIVNFFQEKEFSKNDMLIPKGKICNEYYFMVNGYVRSYVFNLEGDDITTGFCSPNQIACELFSFFKRVPSKEDFQALSDCNTLSISFEDLQIAFHTMPEFREFGRAILVNAYAMLKQNMIANLQETAEERYAHLLRSNPDIFQHAPLKTIASYLGVTDTSLSRIRKDYAKK